MSRVLYETREQGGRSATTLVIHHVSAWQKPQTSKDQVASTLVGSIEALINAIVKLGHLTEGGMNTRFAGLYVGRGKLLLSRNLNQGKLGFSARR